MSGEGRWDEQMPDLAFEEAYDYEKEYQAHRIVVIDARQGDATTCPGCRSAVPIGQFCGCPMRWKG